MGGRIVDVMVIGAQKAGTSWLWEGLRRHPGIFTPPVKELHFYDHRHCPANQAWTREHLRRGVRAALRWHVNRAPRLDRGWIDYLVAMAEERPFSRSWYRAAFARAPSGALRLDATPEYASLPPGGVAAALSDNPGLRAIHILRDPVDRALSQIRMGFFRRGVATPSRVDWAAALADPDLVDRSDYARHIETWDSLLPPERMLRLDFAWLEADPGGFLGRVERFLNLPPGPRPDGFAAPVHAGPRHEAPDEVRSVLSLKLARQRGAMEAALARAEPARPALRAV